METGVVRIYSTENTPRLKYISALIFGDMLGLPFEIITDKRKARKQPLINYSTGILSDSFKIIPDTLLFEKGISDREIYVSTWKGLPVFFRTDKESDFPFDIFAASFYLVSRYEEYFKNKGDKEEIYKATSSAAYKNGFLESPVIDLWVKELVRAFIKKFSNFAVKRNEFRSLLSIDTDQAFPAGKSLFTSLGGIVEGIRHKRSESLNRGDDHADVFEYIFSVARKNQVSTRFFIPVGDHSKYDKNPSWKDTAYRKLISRISEKFDTGLSSSYRSGFNYTLMQTEKQRLEQITGTTVRTGMLPVRRFRLPESYRYLLDLGIREDYSMGYADEPGFRAGIARPFYFYDIFHEKQTELKVFPFQIMDDSFFLNRNMDTHTASDQIIRMIDKVRSVGGLFISIWHNTSLLEEERCRKARKVFENMLKNQVYDNLS